MKPSDVKDVIVDYLEHIVNRINYINHHHPETDLSLDIDLVKDDLRVLYGKLEFLKSMAIPKNIFVKDEQVLEEENTVKKSLADDHGQQHQEEPIKDSVKASKKLEEEPDQPSLENETHEFSPQAGIDDKPDAKPEEPEETIQNEDAPAPASAQASEKESGEEQQPLHADLQYHQAGIDFTDNAKQAHEKLEVEKPGDVSESTESEIDLTEDKKEETRQSNKTVIDLLSTNGKKTIGDQYVEVDNSINKRISANKEDKSIGARMQQKPVSNIKEVIGVNEKFLFINELFDGNIQEYHDAIARLNDMQGMQEAFDYLNVLSEKYSWDASRSSSTIEKLANYVQRRYM